MALQGVPVITRRFTAAILIVAGSCAPALAEELVRFKSGFEMQAHAIHYEGEMAILTLDGGSEIGFPKSILDLVVQDESIPGEVYEMFGRNKLKYHFMANGTPITSPRAAVTVDPSMGEKAPETPREALLALGDTSNIGPGGMNVGFSYDGKTGRTGRNAKVVMDGSTELVGEKLWQFVGPGSRQVVPARRLSPSMLPELRDRHK